jgi:hypothetical protein
MHLEQRYAALAALLDAHAGLWRPAPFHVPRPGWCETQPALAAELLALTDTATEQLANDTPALILQLAAHRPELAALAALVELPQLAAPPGPTNERLLAQVPGRKQAQIRAFAAAIGTPRQPLLEWCAGKGHLGRLLAHAHALPVDSLEIDGSLIAAGQVLAERAGVCQHFIAADALAPASGRHLHARHAVALHACGDLHRALIEHAIEQRSPALDLVPCCYYRTATPLYRPYNGDAGLELSRDELHLAVTETVTAGARQRRDRDTAQAWKLAFLEWRASLGIGRERPFKPIPQAWLAGGFDAWLRRVCCRDGLASPTGRSQALESLGWRRQAEVRRLELVRLAFRRPLEIWLALDRAIHLQRAGYMVKLAEFCPRQLTPRNLLIQARS